MIGFCLKNDVLGGSKSLKLCLFYNSFAIWTFLGKGWKISKKYPKNDPKIDAKIQQIRFWVAKGAPSDDLEYFWACVRERSFFNNF